MARACRASVLADAVERVDSAAGAAGVEDERLRAGLRTGTPLGFEPPADCCISPLAVASLLVKDEMAHPAQEAASADVVPMRGMAPLVVADAIPVDGGRAVSGRVAPYLRMRVR